MKLFQCQYCNQILHFENTVCLRCNRTVGYLPDPDSMAAVEADGPTWIVVNEAAADQASPPRWRFCRNWELSACNWMVEVGDPEAIGEQEFCPACRHNRTVPDLADPTNHTRWLRVETAKRRLIYTLRHLGLPCPGPGDDHPEPLVFDFLADAPDAPQVLTGHAHGVVTVALTEADDATREKMRSDMGEAYRTLLGHFRHEVGHYYWDLLIRDGGEQESFRALFGDEQADYGEALDRHYRDGAPDGWPNTHISAYATMHPWEDWAETWAHYLHMVDTLETAAALGIRVGPPVDAGGDLSTQVRFDPYRVETVETLLAAWMPLTVALNTLSRSMGQADIYPFALAEPVQQKIGYVHRIVSQAGLEQIPSGWNHP